MSIIHSPASAPQSMHRAAGAGPRMRLLADMPVRERRLPLAGIQTAVLEGGEGEPIVLLHGPGEYGAKWRRILPVLVATHRVIAPDLPGHGETEAIEAPLEPDQVLAWLGELIEQTCPSPPILVGQILGGAIAARFAATHGERIRALVLSDTLGLAPFEPAPQFGAALTAFLAEPGEASHDGLWQQCAFDLDRLRAVMGEEWDRIRAYNLDRSKRPELKATQQSLMERFGVPPLAPDSLAGIAVPVTLVWGREDRATRLAVAEAASARFGWPLHVIDAAGDDPPIEQPAAFLRALAAAIDTVSAAQAPETALGIAWDRVAPGYDRVVTASHMALGEEALRRAGLCPGTRFLDVAAGSGALGIPAARMGAEVTAVDVSPAMLALLARRAREEGLPVATRVMDGEALELADGVFDMAGSQFGVMLFPDMPKGIAEMARVVRPGGRVVVVAFGEPREVEFLDFLARAVRTVRPGFEGLPQSPPPLPFQLRDPQRLREVLAGAGLGEVSVETTREQMVFRAGRELWEWLVWSNPIVETLLGELALEGAERERVRAALEDAVRERAGGGAAAVLASPIHIGIGRRTRS